MATLHSISLTVVTGLLLAIAVIVPADADTDNAGYMLGANSLDSTVSVYHVAPQGTIRHQAFFPTAKNPKAVAIHPSGKFAYVVAKTANALVAYELVEYAGRLELHNPTTYNIPAKSPFSLVIHPSGEFLYVAAREGKIAAYRINAENGLLTPAQPPLTDSQYRTRSLVIHNSGRFLYAVNAYANSVSAYRIDAVTGGLTPLQDSPFAVTEADVDIRSLYPLADVPPEAGGIPYYAALEPQGRFLYVSVWGAGKIAAFGVDQNTGALQALPGSPYDTGLNPYAIAIHPSGRYLYAGSWKTSSLWAYTIDQTSGALKALAPESYASVGSSPVSIVFNSDGSMAYVANAESANVSALRVNRDTGEASLLQTTQTRPGPWWLTQPLQTVNQPSRVNIYTLNHKTRQLSLWEAGLADHVEARIIDAVTLPVGALLAVSEKRGAVYAADVKGKAVIAYQLDHTKRRLVPVDQSSRPIPGTPVDVTIDSNGWYLYVVCKDPDLLIAFGIDYHNASLIPMSQPVPLPFDPGELVIDPPARYAYVFSADGQRVSLFSYRQNTGPLLYERSRFGSPFSLKKSSSAALVDPGANFILTTEQHAIGVHRIDALSGAIGEIAGSPFTLNANISNAVMHHSGNYLYVFDKAAAKLFTYAREAVSGAIQAGHIAVVDLSDKRIGAITLHNDFMYLADESANRVLIYAVDPGSGALQPMTQVPLPSKADIIGVTTVN